MNKFIIVIISILISSEAFGCRIIEEILEPAIIEVKYERVKVLDTIIPKEDFRKSHYTLKVGSTVSGFYSADKKSLDSLLYRHPEAYVRKRDNKEVYEFRVNLPADQVYKNYPEGKVRVLDRFDLSSWQMDEEWEKPEWTIGDSIVNVLGYDCVKAETDFRGRHWIAWFTFDIPISDGPWKLCGLPGLILRAYDDRGHYTYEAVDIGTEGIGDVEFFDYMAGDRFYTSREKGMARKWKALHQDLYYKIASSGVLGPDRKAVKERKNLPHKNHDFEETDYPHEK